MPESIILEVKGIEAVKKAFKEKNKKVLKQVSSGLNEATLFLKDEIKLSIAGLRSEKMSVDSGRFFRSVKAKKLELLSSKVYTTIPYAPFLEYGTTKISPRSHFRNSAARSQKKIKQIISEKINLK